MAKKNITGYPNLKPRAKGSKNKDSSSWAKKLDTRAQNSEAKLTKVPKRGR